MIFMMQFFPRSLASAALALALIVPGGALAQGAMSGVPNAMQGFSQNRDQPVHIEAATLEVRDKDKVATFSGDVRVKQGDTGLRCKSLLVFYEQDAAADKTKSVAVANPGPDGQQRIKRLEARGGVVVTQKQQTATGETGIFDMKTNTVTLTGNVVMTTGPNVLRGERLDQRNHFGKTPGGLIARRILRKIRRAVLHISRFPLILVEFSDL